MEAKGDRNPIIIFPMQQTPQILLPPPPPPLQSSHASITSFPILALTVLGIVTTSIVLLTYYIFVVRCCLNWHHSDVVSLVARRHNRRGSSSNRPPATYMPSTEAEGLDESAIQALPAFRYRKVAHIKNMTAAATFNECAVCLSEFQEEEKIRLLPNCFHVFHVDCIDTWLQANAKCPLCRAAITTTSSCQFPVLDQFLRPEEVVIQVVSDTEESTQQQETSRGATSSADTNEASKKRKNMFCHITSKGDECIGVRRVRDVPMRRSFSMDSLTKIGEVQLQVQKNLQKNPYINSDDSSSSTGPESPSFKQQHIGANLPI